MGQATIKTKTMTRDLAGPASPGDSISPGGPSDQTRRQDLLHRFAATPHGTDIRLMGRTVRLEASGAAILELARSFFRSHQVGTEGVPEFHWRIVCEPDPTVTSTTVPLSACSDPGLEYVSLGQRGFLAVDFENREAAACLSEQFLEDVARFRHRPPLDILFCMTAPSLGLTTLSGACVGVADRCALIFGPPNSGKTTSSYLAARAGMDFHADQIIFLDMRDASLRAWGDPFPVVFRPEARQFLPELESTAIRSTYEHLEFYYFDKSPLQPRFAKPLTPVCGLFLNRNAEGDKQLTALKKTDALSRLHDCLLFDEDERFDEQISAALSAVSCIPIYDLSYRQDPGIATGVIKELLS